MLITDWLAGRIAIGFLATSSTGLMLDVAWRDTIRNGV